MTLRIDLPGGQHILEAFTGRHAVRPGNGIALPAGEIETETRLDHRNLIDAGEVVRPLRIDVDAALCARSRPGALHDRSTVATGACARREVIGDLTALSRRIPDRALTDVLRPVIERDIATQHPAVGHTLRRRQ